MHIIYHWQYSHKHLCFQIYSWSRFWLGFFGTFQWLFLDSKFLVKLITNKISDHVGCSCAILGLFGRLCIGMHQNLTNTNFATQIILVIHTTLATYQLQVSLGMEPWYPSANGGFINRGGQFLTSGWMTPKSRN